MDEKKILSQNDIDALLGGGSADDATVDEVDLETANATGRDGQSVDEIPADEGLPSVVQLSSIEEIPAPVAEAVQEPAKMVEPEPAPKMAAPSPSAAPPPLAPVAAAPDPMLEKKVSQLAARLGKIDVALKRLDQIDKAVGDMTRRYSGLANQLQRSFGVSAHQGFACSSCGNHGNVATKVRCTSCGHDALWGWWPKNGTVNRSHQGGLGEPAPRRVRSILSGRQVVVTPRPFGR